MKYYNYSSERNTDTDTDPVAHVEVDRRGVVGGVGEAGQRATRVHRRVRALRVVVVQ